jgi:hypothetical protein
MRDLSGSDIFTGLDDNRGEENAIAKIDRLRPLIEA